MQRRLIVMRHAKSSWGEKGLDDHERPLNERGRRDAPRIGERLASLGWGPDLIWSSDALRTRETAGLLVPAFAEEPSLTFDASFYLADLAAIRTAAEAWPDGARTALVLGHNPGWEQAASLLAGRPVGMTTANAVLLESDLKDAEWSVAIECGWRLEGILRPKEL